jgi:hypothetical protein
MSWLAWQENSLPVLSASDLAALPAPLQIQILYFSSLMCGNDELQLPAKISIASKVAMYSVPK